MATANARRVAFHLPQKALAGVGELTAPLEHQTPLHEVGSRGDQHTLRLETVPPRTSGLLLIVLERPRGAGVHDEPHVGPVDAHTEGDGGDDDVHAFAQKRVLITAALRVREPRVIRQRRSAEPGQPPGKRIDFPARRAVDDSRLTTMAVEHVEQLTLQAGSRQHPIEEIWPVERADELERIVEGELRGDVLPNAREVAVAV